MFYLSNESYDIEFSTNPIKLGKKWNPEFIELRIWQVVNPTGAQMTLSDVMWRYDVRSSQKSQSEFVIS